MEKEVEHAGYERWIQLRNAAGYQSDSAVERALNISSGQIWRWVVQGREPDLVILRRLKTLLGVSLDALDDTIVSWRNEIAAKRRQIARTVGGDAR